MSKTDIFHYPPDLFDLIVDCIPLLNRSKNGVILFFKGAGVQDNILSDLTKRVEFDRENINKYEITRTVLTRINLKSDKYLRERREILKRISEFESFSNCWENDRLKAKGLVSEIRKIINVKDSFTRMNQERESERKKKSEEYLRKIEELRKRNAEIDEIKREFFSLFSETNPHKRGAKLEVVLNKLFSVYKISIRDAFQRTGEKGEGVIEQIDGVIEIDNQIYLVEMKWHKEAIGNQDIFAHLGRIYHRSKAHGIYISASGYTSSGLIAAKEGLIKNALLVLCDLQEFVELLENREELQPYLRKKIQKAILDKEPFWRPQ